MRQMRAARADLQPAGAGRPSLENQGAQRRNAGEEREDRGCGAPAQLAAYQHCHCEVDQEQATVDRAENLHTDVIPTTRYLKTMPTSRPVQDSASATATVRNAATAPVMKPSIRQSPLPACAAGSPPPRAEHSKHGAFHVTIA